MPPVSARPSSPPPAAKPAARAKGGDGKPFLGLIDAVVVEDPAEFIFDGAVGHAHALLVWTWMRRDLAPDLVASDLPEDDPAAAEALELQVPALLTRARDAIAAAGSSLEAERRLKTQVGGDEAWLRLPMILNALKCRVLLKKAQGFGRATNGMNDEAALALALQSMPLQDQAVAALLMQAAVGQVINPSRLMTAAIRIAGAATDTAIIRSGFSPLVDAILAHAQSQLPTLRQAGTFADIDLTCRAIDRFHRLVRSVNGYIELSRQNRWTTVIAALTKSASEQVEPKLREVGPDLNKAFRRVRDGKDRLDPDDMLAALNGMFLLATVRDCRESLALNALFDQVWSQAGQALEIHIQRNLEVLRENPADTVTGARLDALIKMSELRFNAEYADVLRRTREAAERRTTP